MFYALVAQGRKVQILEQSFPSAQQDRCDGTVYFLSSALILTEGLKSPRRGTSCSPLPRIYPPASLIGAPISLPALRHWQANRSAAGGRNLRALFAAKLSFSQPRPRNLPGSGSGVAGRCRPPNPPLHKTHKSKAARSLCIGAGAGWNGSPPGKSLRRQNCSNQGRRK